MLSLALLALPSLTLAAVVPTAPGPGDVFDEGTDCTLSWTPDTTGKWTDMTVKLMTGANLDMVELKTILSSYDGTSSTGTYSYPCPTVTPNSAIYFYQFENGADSSSTAWTTRFAIADASGNTTPPPNETDGIAWGTGSLVGSSGSSNSSSSASASGSASSGSSSTSGSSSSSTSGASTTSSSSEASSTSGRQTSTQVVTSSPSASPTADSGDTTGGAQGLKAVGAGALAGLAALGLLL